MSAKNDVIINILHVIICMGFIFSVMVIIIDLVSVK